MRRTWKRKLMIAGGSLLAVFVALTIVVHIPAVQYAMGWRHPDGTGTCPFGYDKPRVARARVHTGSENLAPARPALGFTLAATTRDDLMTWAKQHHITCESRHGKAALECFDVPGDLIAEHGSHLGGTTIWFELDEQQAVETIKIVRRTDAATNVASAFSATEAALRARMGAPTTERGSADPADLSRGAFRQAMVEHTYADYRAQIRATNMGNGYILTESYTAL